MRRIRLLVLATIGLLTPLSVIAPAHADSDRAYVEGSVTDAAGHAFAAIRVEVAWCRRTPGKVTKSLGCTSRVSLGEGTTEATGTYLVALEKDYRRKATGRGHFIVHVQSYKPRRIHARIASPRIGHDVTAPNLVVSPTSPATVASDAFLQGALTAASGAPVTAASISVEAADGTPWQSSFTDRWGRYSLSRASYPGGASRTGAIRLAAYAPGFMPAVTDAFAFPDSGTLTRNIALTPLGVVVGRVAVPHRHRGWRAHVTVVDAAGHHVATAPTEAHGRFRVGNLKPGDYTLEVMSRRFHPSTALSQAIAPAAVAAGALTDVGTITARR